MARCTRTTLALVAVLVAALAVGAPLAAQGPSGRSLLIGSVSSRANHMPVVGAEVSVPALGRLAQANATGDFQLTGLPAGAFDVLVRAVGFRPTSMHLTFTGADTLTRDLELDADTSARVTVLPTVPVTAHAPPITDPRLATFERRRSAGVGHFITREQLEGQSFRKLGDVLRTVPGTNIVYLPSGGTAAAAGRGTIVVDRSQLGGDPSRKDPKLCYASVYLDGIRIYVSTPGISPPNLDQFAINEIAGIEYYAGAAQTPVELNAPGSACGTLVIWTRTK